MQYVGIDIGGAHLKAALFDGTGREIGFPVWREPERLGHAVADLIGSLAGGRCRLGVTMTAELADCFESRQAGVHAIVSAVEQSLAAAEPRYYQTNGQLVQADEAISQWTLTASSNWHASAVHLAPRLPESSGWIIDIGSTTTDLIPVGDGRPRVERQTDLDRLASSQLVYAGVGRTPVCALLDTCCLDGRQVGIAREVFATTADAMRWLGRVALDPRDTDTADGRPATRDDSGNRLARMAGTDRAVIGDAAVEQIARQTVAALERLLETNLGRLFDSYRDQVPGCVVLIGSGADALRSSIADIFRRGYGPDVGIKIVQPEFSSQLIPARAVAAFRKQVP